MNIGNQHDASPLCIPYMANFASANHSSGALDQTGDVMSYHHRNFGNPHRYCSLNEVADSRAPMPALFSPHGWPHTKGIHRAIFILSIKVPRFFRALYDVFVFLFGVAFMCLCASVVVVGVFILLTEIIE